MCNNQPLPDSVAALSVRCLKEMRKFRDDHSSDDRPCLELLRRAVVEGSAEAWDCLVLQYRPQVRVWVNRYLNFPVTSDEIESLVQDAFTRFWRFFDEEAWHRARGLREVLAYLRTCVLSAVAELGRERQKRALEAPLDESRLFVNPNPASNLDTKTLWAIVAEHCRDETDFLLARQVLAGNLRPRHIYDYYHHLFGDIYDVYRRKRNLLERLQRDTRLRDEFGS